MPLYEYECARCGKRFELIQKFSAPAEAACPACSGRAHRLLSAPALQFKGSGWTVSDYARRNAGPHSGKSSAPDKKEGAADGGSPAGAEAKKKASVTADKD